MTQAPFFSRDISWLSFNQRVLMEAANKAVPAGERLKFLSIFSSNLDEFYRVRMPVLMAKQEHSLNQPVGNLPESRVPPTEFDTARQLIAAQQREFGRILRQELIPLLEAHNVTWIYDQPLPPFLLEQVHGYFFTRVAAFLQWQLLTPAGSFFPKNNELYLFVPLQRHGEESLAVVNIPSNELPRFFSLDHEGRQYVLFIDDLVKWHLSYLFPDHTIAGAYSFKITRDAELNLEDELPEKIEQELVRRDEGPVTRLLHQPGLPLRHVQLLSTAFNLSIGNAMEGGMYHNLKDMAGLPLHDKALFYPPQRTIPLPAESTARSIFSAISERDIILHPPYQRYGTVLRFFNEAALDAAVEEIYATLYRIAPDSGIAHALISAARNGKRVQVFVELKARFDEANNIRWANRMKEAGVKVIYSIPRLKVHAKIALVKKRAENNLQYFGLLATGNLNENTARFYTDHVLLTAHSGLLQEMELLFLFLAHRKKPEGSGSLRFNHLLVAQFNLQQAFLELIGREILFARAGRPSGIAIKLNNLEEPVLIRKLYEAARAGVPVRLIVRSICCLVPGVPGQREGIAVKRIVGRYLEHGRVFCFQNGGEPRVFMGSADWMNRNIYARIEVCFPIYDPAIRQEILQILEIQLKDNTEAVLIDHQLNNVPLEPGTETPVHSQAGIYALLASKTGIHDP
ncbi:MAG: polyphosphate kinase 1 [Williamsia sp.]|nr:polyphosphate kinase 1 [Williamsia sp.]